MVSRDSKSTICKFSFFLLIIIKSGLLTEIRWSVCMSKSHRTLCVSFLGQVLGCAYTICSYGQISIFCTFPSRSPCPPSRLVLYSFCANLLHSLIMWLIVSSLSPHSLHFVESYLFSLWYVWFLWHCFLLLLGEILFLSKSFLFLATSRFCRVRYCLLVF